MRSKFSLSFRFNHFILIISKDKETTFFSNLSSSETMSRGAKINLQVDTNKVIRFMSILLSHVSTIFFFKFVIPKIIRTSNDTLDYVH